MGFTKPDFPNVDPDNFMQKPLMERMRILATGLPRVSRTADFVSIYAATCEFRYSVRTSCGVR